MHYRNVNNGTGESHRKYKSFLVVRSHAPSCSVHIGFDFRLSHSFITCNNNNFLLLFSLNCFIIFCLAFWLVIQRHKSTKDRFAFCVLAFYTIIYDEHLKFVFIRLLLGEYDLTFGRKYCKYCGYCTFSNGNSHCQRK